MTLSGPVPVAIYCDVAINIAISTPLLCYHSRV